MNQVPVPNRPSWDVHWLVWLVTIGLDTAIFGGNLTAAVGYVVYFLVAVPYVALVATTQRFAAGDSWRAALAKALVLLVLIGIPTPVASVLGAAGSVAAALSRRGGDAGGR